MVWIFLKESLMSKITCFLAAPISAFVDEDEYKEYRVKVLKLIAFLRANLIVVYSEVEKINQNSTYDSPGQSVIDDFSKICESDFFVMLHPKRIQTSTLMELGYAYALNKKIIIVGAKDTLPYLALGLPEINDNTIIIESLDINDSVCKAIVTFLKSKN